MSERTMTDASYRYAFNGKEKDVDGLGDQTHYDYGFRIYNPEIARFLSVDPLTADYSWYTPYQYAGNKPIKFLDLDGLEILDNDAARPTGIALLEYAVLPRNFFVDRKSGIKAGPYTLYGVHSESSEWWVATIDSDRGYSDEFIVGTESVAKFISEAEKYKHLSDVRNLGISMGGNRNGDIFEAWKSIITNPISWIAGASIYASSVPRQSYARPTRATPQNTAASTTKTVGSAADDIWQVKDVVLYHKGELQHGKVSGSRPLSTGKDFESVSALDRKGVVHEFRIPKEVYDDWIESGNATPRTDYDISTGVLNNEIRFHPDVAVELNKYIVKKPTDG